jgi:hypothetical protein
MKTFSRISALILAFVLTTGTAFAALPDAQTASDNSTRVQAIAQGLVTEGYALESVQQNPVPVSRIAIRKAPYVWGTIVYTYSRPTGNLLLPVDKVDVTVQVEYLQDSVVTPQITVDQQMAE